MTRSRLTPKRSWYMGFLIYPHLRRRSPVALNQSWVGQHLRNNTYMLKVMLASRSSLSAQKPFVYTAQSWSSRLAVEERFRRPYSPTDGSLLQRPPRRIEEATPAAALGSSASTCGGTAHRGDRAADS
jgi:hypothetical protein